VLTCSVSLALLIAPLNARETEKGSLAKADLLDRDSQIRQPSAFRTEWSGKGDVQYASELIQTSCTCAGGEHCNGCVDSGDSDVPTCKCASCKKKKKKPNPCAKSHKPLFYNNDFSYLNDPSYKGKCLGDCMKLNSVGACGRWGTMDMGGQLRVRYHHEQGMGQDLAGVGTRRFENTNHDFALTRLRLYTNWKVNDQVRFYFEGILADASDDGGTYKPRGIDRNYGYFLNLFVDLKLTDNLTVRIGRQELLYGVQRLVSPLDWANTRRTFEGVRSIWKNGDWQIDTFLTNLVPVVSNDLDEADYDQTFYGSYVTYSGWENAGMDVYYLGYDNENTAPAAPGSDFSLHTLGLRLHGSVDSWLWEFEGGPQFGRQSGLGRNHSAGFATAGIGRKMADRSWKPTLWFYYDYASGDDGSGNGSYNGFNQLFPLAHKYFGFIDAVQRSNVEAPNALLTMSPSKKIQFLAWYWHFMANQAGTAVPGIGGGPASSYQNTTSKDLGDELDLICKYVVGPRSNCLVGYSHFWRGNKITAPVDADFVYVQWTSNF